jgi:hypothetical protein
MRQHTRDGIIDLASQTTTLGANIDESHRFWSHMLIHSALPD